MLRFGKRCEQGKLVANKPDTAEDKPSKFSVVVLLTRTDLTKFTRNLHARALAPRLAAVLDRASHRLMKTVTGCRVSGFGVGFDGSVQPNSAQLNGVVDAKENGCCFDR